MSDIHPRKPLRRASRLLSLEQRFMFDAAAVATAAEAVHARPDAQDAVSAAASAQQVRAADAGRDGGRKEVAFVDTSLADYRVLEAGVRDGVAIVEFDGSKDGLAQIAQWAASQSGYDAIHILSHGSEGTLDLGTAVLNAAALASGTVQAELAEIGHALNAGGDLLLYGCDVAEGSDGQSFIDDLARLTGADIAASTDATGAADRGGNWSLEAHVGKIDSSALQVADYQGLLNVPGVSDASISITSTGSGPGGIYKSGDVVTASWNNTAGGDNNPGITSVTVDFSLFGGGSVVATNSGDVWTASYTVAGGIEAANAHVSVSATNADGTTTTADSTNLAVDTIAPTTRVAIATLSADTGSSSSDFITNVAGQTISGTLSANLGGDESVQVSLDNGATWNTATAVAGGNTWILGGVTLAGSNTLKMRVVDEAGNAGPVISQSYALDTTAPAAPSTPFLSAGYDSGVSGTDHVTNSTSPVLTGLTEANATVNLYDTDGSTVLATATADGTGHWGLFSSTLSDGTHTLTAKAVDAAGNVSSASPGLVVTIDTTAPAGLGSSASTVASVAATSGASIATLLSTDTSSVTYSLTAGDGTNDADNGSFSISGNALRVGASSLSDGNYHIYLSATDAAGNVAYRALVITVADAPGVSSIVRTGGASGTVNASTAFISYTVTFDQAVSGVDVSDFTLVGTGTAAGSLTSVSGSGTTYTVTVGGLSGDGTLRLDLNSSGTGIQNGGSLGIVGGYTGGAAYILDHTAPTTTIASVLFSSDSGSSGTDFITNYAAQTILGTLSANLGSDETVQVSLDNGATWSTASASAGGNVWSLGGITLAGSDTLKVRVVDAAGNAGAVHAQAYVLDTIGPTGMGLSATTVASANAASGASIATLSSTDTTSVTYGFVAGNGVIDADNGRFSISGNALRVGATALSAGNYHIYLSATDAAGNEAFQVFTVTVADAPSISSIVRTGGASDSVNHSASSVSYTVTFDQAVTGVSPGDFTLVGTGTASGSLTSLSTSDNMTYIVTVGNLSGDGALRLDLNSSGTGIQNVDGIGTLGGYTGGAAYILDHTAPVTTIASASFSSDTGSSGTDFITRSAAQTVSGTLSANLGSDETVQVSLDNGATWSTASASAGGNTWSLGGVTLAGSDTLQVRVADAAGNAGPAYAQAYVLDTGAPAVESVSVPANGTYYTGQSMDFSVNLSEAVTVDTTGGTPRIALVVGSTVVYADYLAGSGTGSLTFRYTVGAGMNDANGITVGAMSANGGTLRDAAGNDATLTLNSVGNTAAVNVADARAHVIDVSSTGPDGAYKAGDTIAITVTFDGAVTVDTAGGTPTLSLGDGGVASYTSGSGGTTLVFAYTVGAGQNAADLDYGAVNALALNGGSIKGSAGPNQDAILTLSAPGAGGSLGANKDLVIDTTPPAAPTVDPVGAADLAPVLTGAATLGAGETLVITVGDAVYHVTPSAGRWSLDLATAVPASGSLALAAGGTYSVTATATDAVGNASSATGVLTIAEPSAPSEPPPSTPSEPPPSTPLPPPPRPVNIAPFTGLPVGRDTNTANSDFVANQPRGPIVVTPPFLPPSLGAVLGYSPAVSSPDAIAASLSSLERGTPSTGREGLMLNRGIGDLAVQAGNRTEIGIPPDAFADADPDASVQLVASQPDGRPLPNWIRFDSRQGKFIIEAPRGTNGEFAVKVTARDSRGHEATTVFRIRIGDRPVAQPRAQFEREGRPGLSEQIHQAAQQRGNADALGRLAQLAHALRWPNS